MADRIAIAHRVEQLGRRLARSAEHMLAVRVQRLDAATRRLVHPAARIVQERERLRESARRIRHAWRADFARIAFAASTLQARLLRELRAPLHPATRVEHALVRWQRAAHERGLRTAERLGGLAQNLAHLNPQAVLERGYAIVAGNDGAIVQDARQVSPGDTVVLTFARGGADATITKRREQIGP